MKTPSLRAVIKISVWLGVFGILASCRVSIHNDDESKAVASTPAEQAQAVAALKAFLKDLDAGNSQVWEHSSRILKNSTPQTAWLALLGAMRTACGDVVSRGKVNYECTETLPDAPKGRYFVFDIASKFEKADLTERVVLTLEDGQWKVAGYFRRKTVSFGSDPKKP